MEGGKISNRQLGLLTWTIITSTSVLYLPTLITLEAGRDGWASNLILTGTSMLLAIVITSLGSFFPNQTVVEYAGKLLGKVPGKVLGVVLTIYFFYLCIFVLRGFGELIASVFMPETPLVVINVLILILAAFTVRNGLEVIVRLNEILFPVVLFLIFILLFFIAKDLDFTRLLPVFADGFWPVARGLFIGTVYYTELIGVSLIFPYINLQERVRDTLFKALLGVGVLQVSVFVALIGLLGLEVGNLNFPLMSLARYINVGNFIQRMDAPVMAVWLAGGIVKFSFFYYCGVLSAAQVLRLGDYRSIVLPVGVILGVMSMLHFVGLLDLLGKLTRVAAPFFLAVQIGIPVLLLVIAFLRGKGRAEDA